MNRTNRKHDRQIERKRRNKGPELLSRAADNELQQKADQLAESLSNATIKEGNIAAADLLLTLAEGARYNDNPAAFERAFSLAERWSKEPQVVQLDTAPRLPPVPSMARLSDGSQGDEEDRSGTSDPPGEIIDAEWEMAAGDAG
jgi:hypothetical protein